MRAAIGLGGNRGDVAASFGSACAALDGLPNTRLIALSSLYRTLAWGEVVQDDFLNAVVLIDTSLPPSDLLACLLAIERAHGRDRSRERRWGPRTLDLDLLLYGDTIVDEPGLAIPHPQLQRRAFALVPLLEVWPDASIPGIGPANAALAALDHAETAIVGGGKLG